MPAPKRGSTPHDSQPKMRKLDEDGEALPTKIESATNSLITEKKQENTAAAPRTKIKRLLVEKGNTPAKSSKQSSPPNDSSKSPSDPPVKKAKLLTATSASCGEAPSQRANSKASLKRTTSTESDDDLSSDGSKVEFFREKDEDEARCIRKYSNKAKRNVEELSSDPQETSQDLPSSPSDPVQIDHNYGRFSDSTSLQNTGVAEDKDSAVSFTEQESQEISHNATQKVPTDSSPSETGSTGTSIKVESATDEHKDVELQYQDSQTLVDHKTPAFSREMADCVTPVGEKKEKDETESIKSLNEADDKTLASPEKTLCAVTGELISGARVVDERTDSACQSESQTCLTMQSVSEENELNIKSETKEQEVSEAAGTCADKLDGVLLKVTSSVPEHVEISHSDSQPKENVKMADASNTQIDLSQVSSREEFDASDIQAEMPETVVSSCDVNKTLENFEESRKDGVDLESPQTSACSEAVVEVHLNHGAVTPDSCTDTLSECVVLYEENQAEMLSDHLKVPEGQITPEAVLQSEENCLFNEKVTKVATLAEGDSTGKERYMSSVQRSAAEIKEDVQTSNPDVTVKTQNQDAHESTNCREAHLAKKIEPLEKEETVGAEYGIEAETQSAIVTQTVVTSEISNSEPPVETRKQEIQEVSESATVMPTEIHSNATAEKCENMETVECAVIAEGQSGMETHLVATFKLSDPEAKVELQIQESPVSERTAVILEGEKDPENAYSESRNDGECVDFTAENLIEVDKQTAIMSEEVCTQIEETHSHMNQEVSEHTIVICEKVQKVVENANCATQTLSPCRIEVDVLAAATSEDVSNIAHIEETQTPMVSEPTTETYKVQKELENVNCAAQSQIKVVDNVQAAATSEKVSNMAPKEQMQITTDSEPITDAPDDAYTDLENAAFKSSKDVTCVSAVAQSQIEVGVDTLASEKVSIEEMQNQIVSEPTMHTSVKFMEDHWEEHLKTVENNEFKFDSPAVTLSQMEMGTTLAVESSSPTPASGINKSQTEEDMQAPENSSSTALVVETQTLLIIKDVIGQTRDNSNKELHENIIVENLQKVKNKDEVHSGCVTVQEERLKSEMQVTPASLVLEADHSVEIHKSPNETHMQIVTTSEQHNIFPEVEMQNLQSHDVMEEHLDTWSVADEESRNKMETTETSVLSPSAETQYSISNNINESSANVSEHVQANFSISANESFEIEDKAVEECVRTAVGTNKMEAQSAEGLQENSQPTTTKQIPSQRGQEVCELTTDTNILVLQSSTETQIQRSFSVAESFTIPSTEDHQNKSEECIDTAETTHEMETQSPQPTTSENTQIQRGQELSELTADISVSPPPPETQIQRSCGVTEPSSEVSTTVQEDVKIHSSEGHENENKAIYICATNRMYKMEIQTAEELQEILQPTTTEQSEASELTTDISASPPSSETHVQKNLNITDSATNTFVCNESTVVEKALGATARIIEMEMQAAEMLLEVSQPAFTEQRQNLRGQEVCELTTDANISFLPYSSETEIQKSFIVTSPANDASETVQERFSVPLNRRYENGNNVLTECGDTAGRTNKMETQSVPTLEEVSQATVAEQTQNQRVQEFSEVTTDANLSVSPASAEMQIHKSLVVSEAATNVSETVQEMFKISSNECRENEKKAFEKCTDTAEMTNEMKMQTSEALEETFQPTTTEQTQNQRGQKVIELAVDADVSVAPLLAETTIQKSMDITQPASDKSKTFQEKFKISPNEINKNENKAMKECVHTAERTNKMETHPPELLQGICQPTITEQTQNQINDTISTEREQNQNHVITSESHPKIDMQTSLTPEVYQNSDVELQNQRNTDVSEEMDASECENVPEIETDMEASAKSEISYLSAVVEHKKHLAEEITEHTMHLSDEILTPQPVVYYENDGQTEPENDRGDVIRGSMEKIDSALEEGIKVEASIRSAEGGAESSDVIVFVCNQSDDTVIQAPEEQIKTVHQTEVEFYENQVVYEPISSPESNSGEVCTPIQLGETISFLDLQSAETHHILSEESNFLTRDDKLVIAHPKLEDGEIVKEEMCASDYGAAVLMEVDTTSEAQCPAHAHLEQSNKTDDVTHVAAINSSNSSATDGRSQSASKQGESWDVVEHISAAELTEQMQKDTEVHDATVFMVTTPASTEIEITNASSEQMQEDTGVKGATGIMVTTTAALTEVKITNASSEQVQEDTGVQDATVVMATATPAPTEVEVVDASSERVQEDTGVQDATVIMATNPSSTEVEIIDASSEQVQEDTGVQDATVFMATATPAPTEVEVEDASSERVQENTGVQDATVIMAAATPASTVVEITNASHEQMQESIEDEEATGIVATATPAPTEVEITDASSEQVQEDTGFQDATTYMATATPAPTEVEITDASSEQVQEDTGVQDATVFMATATPASTVIEITNASHEQMQESIEDEEATGIVATATPAPTEVEITDASAEQVQEDTGVQDATIVMVTNPSSTEVEITDASSEQVQEDTGVQDTTTYMATATPASTEDEITNASCEQLQESIEDEEATGVATATPALTEVEVVDASSELMQEDTRVQDAMVVMATATPAPIEVEVVDPSSEQMQEDTGVEDATANMTTTPASTEVEITDSSSEQMHDIWIQNTTVIMATTTTGPTEVEITDASSEHVQEDIGVQDVTVVMATASPALTEVEITDASSEQMQEDTAVKGATGIMVTTTLAPTEVEITDASSEQVQEDTVIMATTTSASIEFQITADSSEPVQEDTGAQNITVIMATTPAPTEVEIIDASSEQMQQDTGIQDAAVVMVTTPEPTEGEITDASSEQMQQDTGIQDAAVVMVTTPEPTEGEITDASSEQVQQDTGIQDATVMMATATPAPIEFQITADSSEWVQEDTGVQDTTTNMATATPAPIEFQITDASSEQMQQDAGVQIATVIMATTPALTEFEITSASSEQVQEDTGVPEATVIMVTTTPDPTEGEIIDASSEQVQDDTGVPEATFIVATTTTGPTEVEVEDASSEQMQIDTGIQDTTANMMTATPEPTEGEITDASSEQVQEDIGVQDTTNNMATATPAPIEFHITDASSEQMQQDAGVQDATANMATTTPALTEFEITNASSEQVQEDTGIQDATVIMVTASPAPIEFQITADSSEHVQEDSGVQDTTTNMATATPAPIEFQITDASSEKMQQDAGVQDTTANMMSTTTEPNEFEITSASSEQVQEDTEVQDATVIMVTATPAPAEVEITEASSEQVQEDTGVPDATDNMMTTTSASTEGEVADASTEAYVILEPVPVPESEIHFDIVTQAVAESGLSASLGPDEEMASQSILNSSPQTIILEAVSHQGETNDEVNSTTVTSSGEVLEQETETNSLQDAPVSDCQPSSASVDVEMVNCHHTNNDSTAAVMENVECTLDQDEVQILEVMEIGREVVVMEEDNKEDSDVVVIKQPAQPTEGSKKSEEEVNVTKKQDASKAVKKKVSAGKIEEIKGQEVDKPKKQEMNMQARTKARLAALAEQKAAAAKRSANRQQLNLLALCQEIAEDIATDSMLLKKIEEEKQAAAAAEAAKAKAIKNKPPDVTSQEAEPDNVVTPAGPEESPVSETPTPELPAVQPAVQPSTADSAEPKPAAEPPKRRFFISQISVPLKAHEKKKLTRYQRLRQVELQREKMSWARVKKLKSDQTNQMFSDVDWQSSFSGGFFMGSTTPPQASSPSKTPPISQTTATQLAQPKGDSPKIETPTSELVKTEVDKTEPTKMENTETELVKTEPAKAESSKTEPSKTETCTAEPVKAETTKTEAPNSDNRRITRQSKAQASKAAVVAPKPAPKVTRSTSKRSLPAVPPPMPNGLNAQKPKPVEYKPYRPRPKYSFDDFELDDDDSLLVSTIKPNLSTQPPRPCPTSQSKPPLKPTVSSQPANQAKLTTAPPGPTRPAASVQAHLQSAKSKPTVTAAAQLKSTTAASSKPVPSTSTQLKTPILAASQSKPASAQPKPAASASPQLKPAGLNVTKQFAPAAPHPDSPATTEIKPAAAKTGEASVPQKTENTPSQENEKCKTTADPLSSLPASSLPSVESTDGTKTSEESPADTAPNSSAENETKMAKMAENTSENQNSDAKTQDAATFLSDASLQKEVKKLKEADKDGTQTIIDAGQKHFGPVACSGCGMLYSAANPEDESQHLLFHNQFVSAVKYVGWKKERILAEFPDGKIILVLPDDPKYALKKVEEIREMVDNDLGFQQVETKCPSQTKTFLFISIDKKVAGCLIAEHIQEGYRVIEEALPEGSEGEKMLFERQKAWCCSTTPDPAICGISRIWVVSMMRRRGIATRMIECLRNNFIYGSYLRKDEIAFSDPTPDGKLFASRYFGTSQFLVYNFVSGLRSLQPKTQAV